MENSQETPIGNPKDILQETFEKLAGCTVLGIAEGLVIGGLIWSFNLWHTGNQTLGTIIFVISLITAVVGYILPHIANSRSNPLKQDKEAKEQ
jgi:uncharacterized protein YacL